MKIENPDHVTRQNFSLPRGLMQSILDTAHALNQERGKQIVRARGRRVSYSKVVAVLAWLLKTEYLDSHGRPTPKLRELLEAYERSRDQQKDLEPSAPYASRKSEEAEYQVHDRLDSPRLHKHPHLP